MTINIGEIVAETIGLPKYLKIIKYDFLLQGIISIVDRG